MILPVNVYAELLCHRIFDLLWRDELLDDGVDEIHIKRSLIKDMIIQLENFRTDIINEYNRIR